MKCLILLILIFPIFIGNAFAQPQDNKLFYSPWKKVCESTRNKSTVSESSNCVVERFAYKDKELTVRIGGISIQPIKDKNEFGIAIISPLGLKIAYGVEIQIPSMKPIKLPFLFCDRPGCFSQFVAEKALAEALYKTKFIQLRYQLINDQYLELSLDISDLEIAIKKIL